MLVIEIYTSVRFTLNYHEKCLGIVLNGFGCLPKSYCFLLCSLVTIGWVSQRHRMVLIEWHGHTEVTESLSCCRLVAEKERSQARRCRRPFGNGLWCNWFSLLSLTDLIYFCTIQIFSMQNINLCFCMADTSKQEPSAVICAKEIWHFVI